MAPARHFSKQYDTWTTVVAIVIALLGSIFPAIAVVELWSLPPGAAIRPMELGVYAIVFGLGTPVPVVILTIIALTAPSRATATGRGKWFVRSIDLVGCLLGFLPLFLTTVVASWIIRSHYLVLKP